MSLLYAPGRFRLGDAVLKHGLLKLPLFQLHGGFLRLETVVKRLYPFQKLKGISLISQGFMRIIQALTRIPLDR